MITRRELARALTRSDVADWVVIERAQDLASIDEHARVRRAQQRTVFQLTVHVDSPAGRGSAHVTFGAVDGSATAAVDQAIAIARSSTGPAWLSRPLAAPARVKLEDTELAERDPLDVVAEIVKTLPRPTELGARLLREQVEVVARQGFHTGWRATLLRADALGVAGQRSVAVSREARLRSALGLEAALAAASQDLGLLASAGAAVAGPCALVLGADAMLHDGPPCHGSERADLCAGGLGVWSAFVSQADAVIERRGLTRYRERTPIAPGANQVAEPLTITSNGALDHGLHSAPVGDHGDAVRRFKLVDGGIAAGLGLTPREAALRSRDPNGGVRNLEVAAGSWPVTSTACSTT